MMPFFVPFMHVQSLGAPGGVLATQGHVLKLVDHRQPLPGLGWAVSEGPPPRREKVRSVVGHSRGVGSGGPPSDLVARSRQAERWGRGRPWGFSC